MSALLHMICDYAPGDLAWSEILAALDDEIPTNVRLITTSVASFDTIATGFAVAQLASRKRKNKLNRRTVLFANCAPRKDNRSARKNNAGEGLVYAKLVNGAELLVVNSGYSLSFVKPHIVDFNKTTASDSGTQFRSRDNFPSPLGACLMKKYGFIDAALDPTTIPDAPESVIAYVDSFGNIKTSIRTGSDMLAELTEGQRVRVLVGDKVRMATVTNGSFSVPEGEIAFAPGSSGFDKPFWELFKRGGSAVSEFGFPSTGTKIEIVQD